MDLTLDANVLYLSRSCSRAATLATGRAAAGIFCLFLTPLLAAQPPENAASVATAIHEYGRLIRRVCTRNSNYSNPASTPDASIEMELAQGLLWPGDIHIERLGGWTHAANHFAGPDCFAEQRDPAIFELAHCAKGV